MVHTTFPSEVLRRYLRYGAIGRAEKLIDKIPLGQLSHFVGDLTPSEARGLFDILFTPERVDRTLEQCARDDLAAILVHIEDERVADLLCQVGGARSTRLLALMPSRRRTSLRQLLQARAQAFTLTIRPISSLMTPAKGVVSRETPVAEALQLFGAEAERPGVLYVVDRSLKLLGQANRQQLEAASPTRPIGAVMVPVRSVLRPSTPAREALPILAGDGAAALPVVNPRGRLVGEVSMDAVRAIVPDGEVQPPGSPTRATGWRRLIPWLAGSALLVVGSAGWAFDVLHF